MTDKKTKFSNLTLDLGISKLLPEWKQLFTLRGLRNDIISGTAVACVAMPLSLAIALASGVPPAVGLITAIIAGVVCSLFGGTPLGISGPAAAMAIVVAAAVQKYGSGAILMIGLSCGLMQALSGVLGLGKLIRFVPLPVVSGFTAGIGAIILIGQLPRALGLPVPDQSHVVFVITHVKDYIGNTNLASLGLSMGTLILAIGLPKIFRKVPAPLIAVAVMTLIAIIFKLNVESIGSIPRHLPLPALPSISNVDIADLLGTSFIFYVLASLETLLSSTAVDKMTGGKRHDSNQELIGQGLGNIFSALFGGIPASGVISRSTLNVEAGAKTRRSGVIQSIIIIGSVFVLAPWIEEIPIAVLAGILLSIALKMLNPQDLFNLWRVSRLEASTYLITFAVIVFVDFIAGVQTGILAAFAILAIRLSQMRSGFHDSEEESGPCRFLLQGPVTFMSSGKIEFIREELERMNSGRGVIIDMSRVTTIDASGAEYIVELVEHVVSRGSQIALQGLSATTQKILIASDRSKFISKTFAVSEKEVHQILKGTTYSTPIDRLIFGVERFQKDSQSHYQPLFDQLAKGQDPHTLFIACSDSRISPNLITSTEPGELFIVRNVGNIIPVYGEDNTPAEGAAIEFSIEVLGVKEIVVCGHSGCGAIKTVLNNLDLSHLPDLNKWLGGIRNIRSRLGAGNSPDEAARLNALAQVDHLKTYPLVQKKLASGDIRLHAWFYNIGTGEIEEWDPATQRFAPIGTSGGSRKSSTHDEDLRPKSKKAYVGNSN